MITTLNIREAQKGEYDDVWAIVRFYKGKSSWIKQVSDLAPSKSLCLKYNRLKDEGKWNKSAFENIYLPEFLNEMCCEQARKRLNELYKADRAGKNIALLCFCQDESLCHRSIIAGILQGVGCNVHTKLDKDYSKYYQDYMRIKRSAGHGE